MMFWDGEKWCEGKVLGTLPKVVTTVLKEALMDPSQGNEGRDEEVRVRSRLSEDEAHDAAESEIVQNERERVNEDVGQQAESGGEEGGENQKETQEGRGHQEESQEAGQVGEGSEEHGSRDQDQAGEEAQVEVSVKVEKNDEQ